MELAGDVVEAPTATITTDHGLVTIQLPSGHPTWPMENCARFLNVSG